MLNWIDLIREVFHALRWRNDERYPAPMCVSPVGNVLMKDIVELMVTEKKVTGRVHDFICFEEKVGVFVNIEALEQYPNQYGSWIISGVQCVPVNAILRVCYHKQEQKHGLRTYINPIKSSKPLH